MSYKVEDRSPGPAAYNPSIRPVVKSPPAYTLAAKRRSPPEEEWKLGPGMYYPRLGPTGPAFSLRSKGNPTAELEKMWLLERSRHPSLRGNTNSWTPKRFLLSEVTPGPGTYTIPNKNSGPAFTVASKRKIKHDTDAPGPGTYFYTTRPQSPAYTMANRIRTSPPPRTCNPAPRSVYGDFYNTPGPAQYNPDRSKYYTGKSGPAYTMRGKWHNGPDSGLPGPGTYFPPQVNTFGQDIGCQHRRRLRSR